MRIINSEFVPKKEKLKFFFPEVGCTQKLDYIFKKTGISTIASLRSTLSNLRKEFGLEFSISGNNIKRIK